MKVHLVKTQGKKREYMCLNEFKNPDGCQMCYLYGSKLVESKLKPPQNIESKCTTCDTTLVSFLDLPDEQKIATWKKRELDFLVQNAIYCPNCRTAYSYSKNKK